MSIIFLLLLVLALLLSSFGWSGKVQKLNAPLSWFFIYVFSVLIGFRSKYSGVDTISYYNYYNDIDNRVTPYFNFEPGFIYFTELMTEIASVEIYIFLLSFIQLLFIYLSAKILKISNGLIAVILYLSFVPGFDMLTNGIRGGMALAIGLVILVPTVIKHNRLPLLNFIPTIMHATNALAGVISLFVKKFANVKMNLFIFSCSMIFFILWLVVNPLSLLEVVKGVSREVNYLGQLIRYLIIEKELMSLTVKLYFMVLSISFSGLYFFVLKYDKIAINDKILTRMAFISLSIQFVYALFSFSEYSYRFMFLAFPLQVLMFCYILDKYFSGLSRSLIVFLVCFFGILTTYSTKTFSSFTLLSL